MGNHLHHVPEATHGSPRLGVLNAFAIRDPSGATQTSISPILVLADVALPDNVALSPPAASVAGVLSLPSLS